jgi:hypothetical protein
LGASRLSRSPKLAGGPRRRAERSQGREDPAAAKTAAREAARAEREAETDLVEKVAEQFMERYAKAHTRDWVESRRLLDRNVIARWQGRKLSQIGRADIHNLLDATAARLSRQTGSSRSFD